jgi:hypothetical protein
LPGICRGFALPPADAREGIPWKNTPDSLHPPPDSLHIHCTRRPLPTWAKSDRLG